MGCAGSSASQPVGRGAAGKNGEQSGFFTQYTLGEKLGKGAFAQVRSAKHLKTDSETWAVKIMDLRIERDTASCLAVTDLSKQKLDLELRSDVINEASVWKKAGKHENIVHLADAFLECGASFFVMEKCDSSLLSFLQKGAGSEAAKLDERSLGRVFISALKACVHIHEIGIVHRDIKPDNFMVAHGVVKMCDFGLATVMPASGGLTGVNGTAPFMPPEMLKGMKYHVGVDIWSVGVMAYVMLFGDFPYNGNERTAKEMKKAIRDGKNKPSFEPKKRGNSECPTCTSNCIAFARALLHRSPEKRVSATEALNSPYLQDAGDRNAAKRDLPCMRPMIAGAVKAGVFEMRRLQIQDDLDVLLNRLQTEFRQLSLPAVDPSKSNVRGRPSIADHSDTMSQAPSITSNMWNQSHSTIASVGGESVVSSIVSGNHPWPPRPAK